MPEQLKNFFDRNAVKRIATGQPVATGVYAIDGVLHEMEEGRRFG